jgi:chromosomal replication initiation ATPase DnaA
VGRAGPAGYEGAVARADQLPLPLDSAPSWSRADLVADASNAAALAWLDRPADWPGHRLALHGPAGTGKTHMLRAIAAGRGWRLVAGGGLSEAAALAPAPGTALDDAQAAPEAALFHLINRAAETASPLLLAAPDPPARWPVRLPDLASRLRATLAVGIGPPSDALLGALLAKHLADRQLRIGAGTRAFLLARLPREAAAIAAAVARLDAAALARRAEITRPFVRAVLFGEDDGSMATAPDASPPAHDPG